MTETTETTTTRKIMFTTSRKLSDSEFRGYQRIMKTRCGGAEFHPEGTLRGVEDACWIADSMWDSDRMQLEGSGVAITPVDVEMDEYGSILWVDEA